MMAWNVLVADDSATVRAVLVKTFQMVQAPFERVLQAANGREALELIEREPINLLFTDINMPEMDGVELIETMAARGLLERIAVAIVSTEGSATRIERLRELGVRAYLRKPFSPEHLGQVLGQMMGEKS